MEEHNYHRHSLTSGRKQSVCLMVVVVHDAACLSPETSRGRYPEYVTVSIMFTFFKKKEKRSILIPTVAEVNWDLNFSVLPTLFDSVMLLRLEYLRNIHESLCFFHHHNFDRGPLN